MRPTIVYLSLNLRLVSNGYESFLPLESNVVDDTPLIELEEVFDAPLTSSSFVALSFSSTPMDTSVTDLILLASSLHLAHYTGLEMGDF